jgi:glycosyltransferase involved in cell wall biosynthesis
MVKPHDAGAPPASASRLSPRPPGLADYAGVAARRAAPAVASRVSIVTVVRNAADTVARTIASVQAQSLPSIEHIVVDGGSTDGTRELVARLLRPADFWISEPDRGIADAFNKGVALARGEFVQFLNADDWLSPGQIATAVARLDATGADFVYGDLIFYRAGRPAFRYCGEPDYARYLPRCLPPMNHPTLLARRALFERVGLFCLEHRYAMEYDWLVRVHRAGGRGVHDGAILGHMTHEGVSNRVYARTALEVRDISIAHGRPRVPAHARALASIAKTRASHAVLRRAPRLYHALRSRINPAYRPIPDGTGGFPE